MSISAPNLEREGMRVDPETGTTEIVEFFGAQSQRLFSTRYIPARPPIGGLLVCPSIYAEHLNSYRMEVTLARLVAARGIAVQRFHYRGHGHSDGAPKDVSFQTMVQDAIDAASRLEGSGVTVGAFHGTRWGALIAASAARRSETGAVALWEPVMSADDYFREAFRAHRIGGLREGGGQAPRDTVGTEMQERGFAEVVGFPIYPAFVESSRGRTLESELSDGLHQIFIGQIGKAREPRPSYRRAIEAWRTANLEVHLEVHRQEEISWFLPNARRKQETRRPLIEATVNWLIATIKSQRG